MKSNTKTPSQLAEEASQSASDAIETTRAYAQNAVNAAGEKVRDLRRESEPVVEQLAARVQQAVQRGLDAVAATSARAHRHLEKGVEKGYRLGEALGSSLRGIKTAFQNGVAQGTLSHAARVTSPFAATAPKTDNPPMAGPTQEELDAKLQLIEAKMDARLASIEGKFDLLFYRMDEMGKGVSNLKWWILGAALSIVVAAVATGVGIQQMTVTTFQAAAQLVAPSPQPAANRAPTTAPPGNAAPNTQPK